MSMSDPHALPDRPKTRRAEPLQPDRPGRGTDQDAQQPAAQPGLAGHQDAGASPEPSPKKQREQSDAALDNVRSGYD